MSSPTPAAQPQESGTKIRDRNWQTLPQDALAGLINAVVSVPDGLASAALAGVNPIFGLYASIVGPIAGGLLVSAQLMQVSTTSASALAAGQALGGLSGAEREGALLLLVLLIGVFLAIFGLLRLGRLSRYVAHSVMTGFLLGVAALLVLDQLAPLVGYAPSGNNEVAQALDLLRHATAFDPPTMLVGILALLLAFLVERTPLRSFASLVALIVPSLLVPLMGWESVQLVSDVSAIPRGVPLPVLPTLSLLTPDLLVSALAIAIIIVVQGAGVSQSVPNPDGTPVNPSRDILAQGVANMACGLFQGIPAGGSVGQTALNVSLGARTRWSVVLGGLWMALIVSLVPGLVSQVPMAVLGALMILAGFSALNLAEARSIWDTGWSPRLAILATFVATLFLPIQAAVAMGVILTILLFVSSASEINLVEMVPMSDGRFEERTPPQQLPDHQVTLLDAYGSLFFAGARSLEQRLPSPDGAESPVVVLRLRGRTSVGATLIDVLDDYADQLEATGGRLYLSGVDEHVRSQLHRSRKLDLSGPVGVYEATNVIGESSIQAYTAASGWLLNLRTVKESDTQSEGATEA